METPHRRALIEISNEIKARMATIANQMMEMEQMLAHLKGDLMSWRNINFKGPCENISTLWQNLRIQI